MKLSEIISRGMLTHRKAMLKINIRLNNKEKMSAGDIGNVLIDYGDGTYHFEYNNFACKVSVCEIEFIK